MHWQEWPSRWRTKDCQAAWHELCSFVLFMLQKVLALHVFFEIWEMIFIGQDQPTLEKCSLKLYFFIVFWLILNFLPFPCSLRVDENQKITIWIVNDWMYLVLARLDDWKYEVVNLYTLRLDLLHDVFIYEGHAIGTHQMWWSDHW